MMTAALSVSAGETFTRIAEGDIATDAGRYWGCSWGDYDQDGFPDLYLTSESGDRLFHNERDGTFARVTGSGIGNGGGSAVWGDMNNDGYPDLFQAVEGTDHLFMNDGDGQFAKINLAPEASWGVSAAWGDYNEDGFLDLFVANTASQYNFLYQNTGDGSFVLAETEEVGGNRVSHGCLWSDYDDDGDIDLFVAQQGIFTRHDIRRGTFDTLSFPRARGPWQEMGLATGDYDNDGDFDLVVVGWLGNRIYRNEHTPGEISSSLFVLVEDEAVAQTTAKISSCPAWGDYDNDGHLDLVVANGGEEGNFLFHNDGDGNFTLVEDSPVVQEIGCSWTCAWADYDNDGDLDIVFSDGLPHTGTFPVRPVALYRNDVGSKNNWVILKLVGTASNRDAIGAKVRLLATINGEEVWQLREVQAGSGYAAQNDVRVHFGLGDAESVAMLQIEWPSGEVETFCGYPQVNTITTVAEGEMETWCGYPCTNPQWRLFDTGDFLGEVHVNGDWVYCFNMEVWFYCPEELVNPKGGWMYRPR